MSREETNLHLLCAIMISVLSSFLSPGKCAPHRQELKRRRSLRMDQIDNEVAVIFGPETSAKQAVETLQHLIEKIKERGLLAGKDRSGKYIAETVAGDLVTAIW
jgi:hypothetical protein